MIYCVILAGGSGERLWPLSRQEIPKQIIQLNTGETLLEQTVKRCHTIVPKEQCCVVALEKQYHAMEKLIGQNIGNWFLEPCSRNTASAMILAAETIYRQNPEAILVFLTADHYIPETVKFAQAIEAALQAACNQDRIILLGIKPTYPATGYGYIQFNNAQKSPFEITQFHEKPDKKRAEQYLLQGYLWNSGMFVCKASVLLQEAQKYSPNIVQGVKHYLSGEADYQKLLDLSIDYAVMEKSEKLSVLPVDFIWSDVGNLETFLKINHQKSSVISVASDNNLVQVKDKLVALVGVNDLCVVENDGVLVVAQRGKVEHVKQVVQQLKSQGKNEHL